MYKIVKQKNSDYIYNVYKKCWWGGEKRIGFFSALGKDANDEGLIKEAMKISHPRTVFYEA